MITLVTGGQRSGKSSFAESLFSDSGERVLYIATAEITDEEMAQRVELHKQRRNEQWRTFECYCDFELAFDGEKNCLLDCVTNSLSRIMYDITYNHEKIDQQLNTQVIDKAKAEFSKLMVDHQDSSRYKCYHIFERP